MYHKRPSTEVTEHFVWNLSDLIEILKTVYSMMLIFDALRKTCFFKPKFGRGYTVCKRNGTRTRVLF